MLRFGQEIILVKACKRRISFFFVVAHPWQNLQKESHRQLLPNYQKVANERKQAVDHWGLTLDEAVKKEAFYKSVSNQV